MPDRNLTGDQSTLVIDGEAIPVVSKSWTYSKETTESNFDDSKNPERGVVLDSPEGELEYDGEKTDLEQRLIDAREQKHRIIHRLDTGSGYRFKGCLITEVSADEPGDDKRSVTISWEGEEAITF
jgi:hypothetical protein